MMATQKVRNPAARVDLDIKPLQIRALALAPRTLGAIMAALSYEAQNCETFMKQNAPWTDRTGNARQGLKAVAYNFTRDSGTRAATGQFQKAGTIMGIVLFHQVPYGIYLEASHGLRFRIIVPTINARSPEVMQTVSEVWSALS